MMIIMSTAEIGVVYYCLTDVYLNANCGEKIKRYAF